jgi:diguanylate cyclase
LTSHTNLPSPASEGGLYEHTAAQASEFLRFALQLMSSRGITTHPNNLRLWYEYASGANAELKETLDDLLARPVPITEETCRQLYARYFTQDAIDLEHVRQEIRSILLEVQEEVGEAGGRLSQYRDTLGRFAAVLGGETELKVNSADVSEVIEETRSTEQSQRDMQDRLGGVAAEMEALRKELEQIREESLTDSLTGVANRKAFDVALEQALELGNQSKRPVCVMIADIDHFKVFNDTFGHLIGDRVLRFVAATLKRCLKGNDRPARFGGEEFAVILPNTALSGAMSVAEQIRREISSGELQDRKKAKSYGRIRISIGVAQFRFGETAHDFIERADQALYRAKRRGRDRVEQAI